MKKLIFIVVVSGLAACGRMDENIDMSYVKDCNDRGGKVERIEYSAALQCIGAQQSEKTK